MVTVQGETATRAVAAHTPDQGVWTAPRRALEVATSLVRDTGSVLWRAGAPMLTLSLLSFVVHGQLTEWAAQVAVRNGPAGLALLIAAVTVRLSLLAMALWFAARALLLDGVPLPRAVRRLNDPPRIPAHPPESDEATAGSTLADAVRLAIAPMVIVYSAWSLIDWDVHSFLVAKVAITTQEILNTGSDSDASNLSFVDGGWRTYIPWAIGLYALKLAIEALYRRWRQPVLDVAIVFCECGWVVLGWLVIARAIFETKLWLSTRAVGHWWHDAHTWMSGIDLPFHLSLADVIATPLSWLSDALGIVATSLLWPLVWISLIGVIVGWIDAEADINAGRNSAARSVRILNRVLNTSTRGLREKWQPLWAVFRHVLSTGVVPILTIGLGYGLLMWLAAWLRVLVSRLLPIEQLERNPEIYDLFQRATEAIVTPVRLAFLVAAFAVVVRSALNARRRSNPLR